MHEPVCTHGFLSLLIHSSLFSLPLPCNRLFPFVLYHFFSGSSSHLQIELHGALRGVRCLDHACHFQLTREEMQQKLRDLNGEWLQRYAEAPPSPPPTTTTLGDTTVAAETTLGRHKSDSRPDGDTELRISTETFQVPPCPRCGTGILKPTLVFFGGSVPEPVVEAARATVLSTYFRTTPHCNLNLIFTFVPFLRRYFL